MANAVPLITRLAIAQGLDPQAVLAVARGEGGLQNRVGDIGDLSGGGSYGPFQLYTKGALPAQYRGRPQAADSWAWSPAGIQYALGRMASVGARGQKGKQAVNTIIRKFERPAAPDKSVAAALARLGTGGSASSPALGAEQTPFQPPAQVQSTQQSNFRNLLLKGLSQGADPYELIAGLPARAAVLPQTPSRTAGMPSPALRSAPVPLQGHPVGAPSQWVGKVEHRTGPSAPHKAETLAFVGRVGQVAGRKLTPWGNESHSLTTVNGTPSQHGTGDAADIPASGADLIKLGQAALIAAGADPKWARSQKGGLFNINGKQVIFNTQQGGDHTDHLHVGL